MTTTQTNAELVRRVYDALDDQDREAFAALCTDGFVLHNADEDIRGLDAVIDFQWRSFFEAFPDAEFTVEDTIAENELVAVRLTITGTHEREFRGIPPTGEAYEITGIQISRVKDGHVAEAWLNNDKLGLLQQLGVVELPTE